MNRRHHHLQPPRLPLTHALVAKPSAPSGPAPSANKLPDTGLAYSGAIVIVALAAVLSANNLLFLILAAMLSILAVSGFVSKLTLAGLEIDLRLASPHISARRKFRATVRVKNLKRWMPSFSIHVTGAPDGKHPSGYDGALFFPAIPGGIALEEPIDLRFPTRGRYSRLHLSNSPPVSPSVSPNAANKMGCATQVIVYPCTARTAPALPSPGRFTLRRKRSQAPWTRPRVLPHPPLRKPRKRPPLRLESHLPHQFAASPRIRPRRRSDDRHLPRPGRHRRSSSLV